MRSTIDTETTTEDIARVNARLDNYAAFKKIITDTRTTLAQKKDKDINAAYYQWLDNELNELEKRLEACVVTTKTTIAITSSAELDNLIWPNRALSFLTRPPAYQLGTTYDELVIDNPTAYSKNAYFSVMKGMLNGLRGTFFSACIGVMVGMLVLLGIVAFVTPHLTGVAATVFALSMIIPAAGSLVGCITFGAIEGYKTSVLLQKGEVDDLSPIHLKALKNNSLINRFSLFKKDELESLNAHSMELLPMGPTF